MLSRVFKHFTLQDYNEDDSNCTEISKNQLSNNLTGGPSFLGFWRSDSSEHFMLSHSCELTSIRGFTISTFLRFSRLDDDSTLFVVRHKITRWILNLYQSKSQIFAKFTSVRLFEKSDQQNSIAYLLDRWQFFAFVFDIQYLKLFIYTGSGGFLTSFDLQLHFNEANSNDWLIQTMDFIRFSSKVDVSCLQLHNYAMEPLDVANLPCSCVLDRPCTERESDPHKLPDDFPRLDQLVGFWPMAEHDETWSLRDLHRNLTPVYANHVIIDSVPILNKWRPLLYTSKSSGALMAIYEMKMLSPFNFLTLSFFYLYKVNEFGEHFQWIIQIEGKVKLGYSPKNGFYIWLSDEYTIRIDSHFQHDLNFLFVTIDSEKKGFCFWINGLEKCKPYKSSEENFAYEKLSLTVSPQNGSSVIGLSIYQTDLTMAEIEQVQQKSLTICLKNLLWYEIEYNYGNKGTRVVFQPMPQLAFPTFVTLFALLQ